MSRQPDHFWVGKKIRKRLADGSIPDEEVDGYAYWYVSHDERGSVLQYFPENVRDDRETVSAAIKNPDLRSVWIHENYTSHDPVGSPLEHSSINCRKDRGLVLEAISFSADAYNYASEDLRADPEIYLAAARALVSQNNFLVADHNEGRDLSLIRYVFARLGRPKLNDSFYSNGVRLYEFIVALELLINHHTHDGFTYDYWSELLSDYYHNWEHAGDYYEEHFPTLFEDWEVVCRVLHCITTTDDSWFQMYKSKWSERYKAYAPEVLFRDEKGMRTDAISNRDFILYALKAGHMHVMDCAVEELKVDPEIRNLLRSHEDRDMLMHMFRRVLIQIRAIKNGQQWPTRPTRHI